ncbi:hypothetical protein ACFQ1S_40515 [Kibdelosporangium lantanae]|uniref:4Fe-4S Mo/W bis-MGD-type domain-containing protein n=1 Tax=Kibdelosporangium lantanae TaxID=1497396 RepID=A0ABW3MQC3_9PSEU
MDQWHKSACILCECNCGIEVLAADGLLKRVRGDKDHVSSQGYTCNKALRLEHYQNGPQRLTTPLRRREDGTYEPFNLVVLTLSDKGITHSTAFFDHKLFGTFGLPTTG